MDPRRSKCRAIVSIGLPLSMLLSLVMALCAAPASAAPTHDFIGTVGSGELVAPAGLAVDASGGDLYVADLGAGSVLRFDAAGAAAPFSALGSAGLEAAQMPAGAGQVAFDNSSGGTGRLYVVDAGTVKAFARTGAAANFSSASSYVGGNAIKGTPNGPFEEPSAVAVGAAGEIFVVDVTATYVYSPAGKYLTRFLARGGSSIGTDRTGVVYVESTELNGWVPTPWPVKTTTQFAKTSPATVVPTALGVDLADNDLYVGDGTSVHQYESFAAGNGEVDAFGDEQLASGTSGIAVDGSKGATAGQVYVSSGAQVERFGRTVKAPDVVTGPASAIDPVARRATLGGTVDPLGRPVTRCEFEYGTTLAYGGTVPCAESSAAIGSGSGPVAVHAEVAGLGIAEYHFRLIAGNAEGFIAGADSTFQTSGAPAVLAATAEPGSTEVRLGAQLASGNLSASWRFEYGPTTAYGSTATGSIPAEVAPRAISTTVTGLAPGTTYHFRVVLTNALGTAIGADVTFTMNLTGGLGGCPNEALRTGPSAFLPECRAYEMVSPVDKSGEAVYPEGNSQATADGEGIAFLSRGAFAGAPGSVIFNTYLARRGPAGWTTSSPDAPQYNGSDLVEIPTGAFDEDLGKTLEASRLALAPGAVEGGSNLYVRDNSTGALTTVLGVPGDRSFAAFSQGQKVFAGASTDWSRIVIEDESQINGEGSKPSGLGTNLYEFSGGSLQLISRLPSGEAKGGVAVNHVGRPVSEDGRRVYFTDAETGVLYLHEVGNGTRTVSEEQRAGAEHGALFPIRFPDADADADGGAVFFSATEGLAEGPAGVGSATLYRYDADDGGLVEITPGAAEGAGVEAILGTSPDGRLVYFTAAGGLGGAAPAEYGAYNIYVWSAGGGIRLIGTTESAAGEVNGPTIAQVSPDGRYLAFEATSLLTPDALLSPHCPEGGSGTTPGRCGEVYEYGFDSGQLSCVSCDGRPDLAGASLAGDDRSLFSEYRTRAVLDGGVVFFQTANPISPRDSNGLTDVYEWRGGGANLISSGTSEEDSYFADSSAAVVTCSSKPVNRWSVRMSTVDTISTTPASMADWRPRPEGASPHPAKAKPAAAPHRCRPDSALPSATSVRG